MPQITVEWEDPLAAAEAGRALSGLDYMRALAAGRLPRPPMGALMGFRVVELESGLAVFEVLPGPQHYNPIGVVHGGLAMTLLDSAMGCSVHTTLPAGTGYTSLEVKVNFVRPITQDTGVLRCEARVIHGGRRVATAEGRITDAAGRLYAHGTTTCMVFSA